MEAQFLHMDGGHWPAFVRGGFTDNCTGYECIGRHVHMVGGQSLVRLIML